MIPPTVEEWNLETESILDLNPDATAEDIEAIMQRPGGPNAAQKEFFKGREDYLQNKENPVNGEVISIYKEGTADYRKNRDKNMAEELEAQYIIYGNEAHSEFYASLHAPTLNYGHRISQDNMEKVAEAYKELHGIVD